MQLQKITISTIFLIISILYISCNDEADDMMEPIACTNSNCLSTIEPKEPSQVPECIATMDFPDNSWLCKTIPVGTTTLSECTLEFMPQYCLDSLDVIEFQNPNGEMLVFKQLHKGYSVSQSTTRSVLECENDPDKAIGFCLISERVSLYLETDEHIGISIELSSRPDIYDVNAKNYGDFLTIVRYPGLVEMQVIVDKRSLSYELNTYKFYDEIMIEGTIYNEVFSNNISPLNISYKYYYNKNYGLFAFEDDNGVTWTLK